MTAKQPAKPLRSRPQQSGEHSERAFPLASLVNLLTSIVAMVVCVNGAIVLKRIDEAPRSLAAMLITATIVLGAVFGTIIGCGYVHRVRSIMICGSAGVVAGLITLAACVAPAPLAAAAVGVFLPLATVIAMRWRTE